MNCIFCFGNFNNSGKEICLNDWKKITDKIGEELRGCKIRITLAGGEPFLFKELEELIHYIHSKGMKVSLITNGYLLTEDFLQRNKDAIETIGISIDSLNLDTNLLMGRAVGTKYMNYGNYLTRCLSVKDAGIKLKINTVISSANYKENMRDFISDASPDKWKVFNMLLLEDENNGAMKYKATDENFLYFLERHNCYNPIAEDNEDMIGSYITVAPSGVLVDNGSGRYQYSKNLMDNSFLEELRSINFNYENFLKRY